MINKDMKCQLCGGNMIMIGTATQARPYEQMKTAEMFECVDCGQTEVVEDIWNRASHDRRTMRQGRLRTDRD